MRKILATLFLLPLAACFDADISISFLDNENAEMNAVMTMGPEFYAMMAQSGEDPCEEGVGEAQADGSFVCTISEQDTIDNLIAQVNAPADPTDADSPTTGMVQGYAIERIDADTVRVSFDLSEMFSDTKPEEGLGEMEEMLRASFQGHAITMNVSGAEIVETNGTVSGDGKTASFVIPLETLLDDDPGLPSSFDVTVNTQ
ncbi:hypothetical protein [Aliiroseovarius sp.]|uniref:hypothetical protein n=1 Tax=Aliiroseovarius sp. TaxID=1872442 RepID=UPI0026210B23|nr:hypothetical protein [Aliiroseovarius sp.]